MSVSHFWLANSAVQTTSDSKPSHSPDFARWRWMNWLRCSSADSGNSSSLAFRPWALNFLLKLAMPSFRSPDVSLPAQYVMVPLALSIELALRDFAPLVAPVDLVPAEPPLSELLLPQAATSSAHEIASAAAKHDLIDLSSSKSSTSPPYEHVPNGEVPTQRSGE